MASGERGPCVARALATYPDIRSRFQEGLPRDQELYVYVSLPGDDGQPEVGLVSVWLIQHGYITGMIEWDKNARYRQNDWHAVPESDLLDWVIVHEDGSEEGHACYDQKASKSP